MPSSFAFSERTSSKHDLEADTERESNTIEAAGLFDSRYWTQLGDLSELRRKKSELSLRILRDKMRDETAWEENDEAKQLRAEGRCHSLESEIFRKQGSRLEISSGDETKNRRAFFMQLWTTSTEGLGITGSEICRENRSRSIQKEFRNNLIEACKSKYPRADADDLWCPILGYFFPDDEAMYAAHVFPWADGQCAMDEIFGREVKDIEELNGIENGLMLSKYAEERIENGDIALVPDVADELSREEITDWSNSNPKEYKIKVMNPTAKGMNRCHPGLVKPRETWNQLDGRRVQFSSDHRPRARYLYWQYCKTVLRHAWSNKATEADEVLLKERGEKSWGTKGPYIKKRMLLAFVEQLGHDHEALMENALVETKDDENPESDPSALLLVSKEIRGIQRIYNEDEKGEEIEYTDDERS